MAFPQKKRTPSFSSSILDSIYRSIDESDGFQSDLRGSININNENAPSSSSSSPSPYKRKEKLTTLQRAIMDDENWLYATTNSSAFSSSEADSYPTKRRTRKLAEEGNRSGDERLRITRRCASDDGQKLKAIKMHEEELKRSKQQPLSPGARLTSFLNSIFQSNAKKVKLCSVGKTTDVKSSSSRSCFSRPRYKTQDNNNCKKLDRYVRLYPVRVTIDGDCKVYVHKNMTHGKTPNPESTPNKSVRRVTSLKEEIKTKVHQTEPTCITRKFVLNEYVRRNRDEGKEEEEEDVWSCSSSDLFELDNCPIGTGRYLQELPVYETTNLKTNQAISRGLLL